MTRMVKVHGGPVKANFRFTLGVLIKVKSKKGESKGHSRKLEDPPWQVLIQKARRAVSLAQGQRPREELKKGQGPREPVLCCCGQAWSSSASPE